jgi:predicted sulfurtransferase
MGTVSNLRIALYYVYVDLPDSQLQEQVKFHTTICQEKHLKGRIRISTEGINGVLSGELEALQLYQKRMATGLALENGDLNFKYCILRDDIPAKCQIFTELTVKKTCSVISLFDMEPKEKTKRRRGEGGKGRWCENEKSVEAGEEWVDNDQEHNSYRSTIREKMMEYSPSRHLSSAEWHQYLSEATDPLLLDCRNVYESRIGYFASDKAPTLLTNTRKYSDLPNILACNPHVQEKQEIFMYCTVSPSG